MSSIPLISHRLFVAAAASAGGAVRQPSAEPQPQAEDRSSVALLEPVDAKPPRQRAARLWREAVNWDEI